MADKTKYNASTTFQTFNGGLFSGLFPTLVSLAGNISTLSAVFNASISNISVVTPTAIGFNYGLTTDYGSIAEATGTGTFSASISGLQCGSKTYHYNAFATNVSGTSTTTDSTFTTGVCSSRKIVVSNPEVSTTNSVVVEQPSTSQTITPTVVQPSAPQTVAPVTVPNNNSIIVPPSFTTYLKLGNRGTEVTKLQDFLVSKGYSLPSGTTGYFGSQTQLALSKYQLDNNITSTGTLGPITRDYINNNTTAPITTTTKYIFNNNLKLNSVSEDVRQLQIYLNNNNFIITETGPGSKGNESTFYGQKTVQAVKKFQEAHVSEILTPNGFTSGTGMFYEGTRKWVNGN
jgi:peptidoglycan hydrolase-like protein with peptidoglycan-binding domain